MGSIPDLPVGTTSPPIPITFKYAPNTELSVIITPADDSQKYI